jgi:hypothetical protein
MDSFTLVAEGLDAGKQFLAALRREGVQVDLVFWHRPDEASEWTFCVATPIGENEGFLGAIQRVLPVRRSFGPDFALAPSDVDVIRSSHRLVRELLGKYPRATGKAGWEEAPLLVTGWEIASELPQWYQVTRGVPEPTAAR